MNENIIVLFAVAECLFAIVIDGSLVLRESAFAVFM